MTAPTPEYLRKLASAASTDLLMRWRVRAVASLQQAADALAAESDRADRAELLIRDAPHESWCASNDWGDDLEPDDAPPCDCWKSETDPASMALDLAELLTWHSDVAEDNSYNDRVRRIHRMTVKALANLTAERDQARASLVEARSAWLDGANWAHPGVLIEIGDNPYGTEATA